MPLVTYPHPSLPTDSAEEPDFEAILLNKMLATMRESIPEGGLFEKSYGEKIYQSMLDEEMTKEWAHGKGMGIGELLYKQLSRTIKPSAGEDGQK